MTHDTLLQINQRNIMRKLGHVHTADALDLIDPLPEAGVPADKPSADLFAPPMPSMPPSPETQPNGQECHAYGAAPGFCREQWEWPDIDKPNPLLSCGGLREVSPEAKRETYVRSKYGELYKWDADGSLHCLPKHRFIYLSGVAREEGAAL